MQNRKMGMSTHVRRQKEEKGHNDINLKHEEPKL